MWIYHSHVGFNEIHRYLMTDVSWIVFVTKCSMIQFWYQLNLFVTFAGKDSIIMAIVSPPWCTMLYRHEAINPCPQFGHTYMGIITNLVILIDEANADIICIQETKREFFDAKYIKQFCPRRINQFEFLPSVGVSGGSLLPGMSLYLLGIIFSIMVSRYLCVILLLCLEILSLFPTFMGFVRDQKELCFWTGSRIFKCLHMQIGL